MNKQEILMEFEELIDCRGCEDCEFNGFDINDCHVPSYKQFISNLIENAEADKNEAVKNGYDDGFSKGKIQGFMESRIQDDIICTTSNTASISNKEG